MGLIDLIYFQIIGRHLREQKARNKNSAVSLLDCALRGVSSLSAASVSELAGVGLHGLVISSGDIRRVQQGAFSSIAATLLALGKIWVVYKPGVESYETDNHG